VYPTILAAFAFLFALATAWTFGKDAERRAAWETQQRAFSALKGEAPHPALKSVTTRWRSEKKGGPLVERCITCHLGVNDPSLAGPLVPAPFRAHPGSLLRSHPTETFGCVSCHRGTPGKTDGGAHARVELREVAGGVRWESTGEAVEPMLRRGTLTHVLLGDRNDVIEAKRESGEWKKANLAGRYATEAALFSAIEAQLPTVSVRRDGARVTIAASDGTSKISLRMKPGLAEVLGFTKAHEAFAVVHIAEDAPSLPVREEPGGLAIPEDALDAFLYALPELEAGCGRCHTQDVDLEAASTFTRGRQLFEDLACAGCHEESDHDRAPPITELTAKTSAAWILEYIRDPRARSNAARMPTSWPVPIDPTTHAPIAKGTAAYDAWEKKMREETLDVAAFLLTTAGAAKEALGDRVRGRANVPGSSREEGEQIFRASGCPSCHADAAAIGAPSNEDFIAYYVEDPSRVWSKAKMPSLRLTRREAASVGKYLARSTNSEASDDAKALENEAFRAAHAERGKEIVLREGCTGCHAIPGLVHPPAFAGDLAAWGTRDVRTLDFGQTTGRADRTRAMFTVEKLDAPRLFDHDDTKSKMPDYALRAAEIRALTVYLEGRLGDPPAPPFDPSVGYASSDIAAGRALFRRSACENCHDGSTAAPSLVGEGSRVQPAWLFAFLKNPGALGVRPPLHPEWVYGELSPLTKLAIRMPTYALSTEETTALVRSFARRDGAAYPYVDPKSDTPPSMGEGACLKCHYAGAFPQERGKTELANMAPNLAVVPARLRSEWVSSFLTPKADGTRHPTRSP
jgi:cytochrome c5